jgi:hypothetical protein
MTAATQVSRGTTPATPRAATREARVNVGQVRRLQWAVRATLAVGVAASVCANVLNARDNPISQAIAAWPPLALLLTVELVSRVPVHRPLLAVARIGGTTVIAGIAAYVSYFHMAAVVSRYGEHQPNPYLLPLSVDGLIVVASVSLVELSGRLRTALEERAIVTRSPAPQGRDARVDAASPAPTDRCDGDRAATADADRARPVPEPAPPVQPVDRGTPHLGNHNGHQVSDRGGEAPTVPLTPLPSPGAPANLTPTRDAIPPGDAAPGLDADPDLVALLPAAHAARDELLRQGRRLSRDSLARQLRRSGHTIRTARVSRLLTLLRNDPTEPVNGRQPPTSG